MLADGTVHAETAERTFLSPLGEPFPGAKRTKGPPTKAFCKHQITCEQSNSQLPCSPAACAQSRLAVQCPRPDPLPASPSGQPTCEAEPWGAAGITPCRSSARLGSKVQMHLYWSSMSQQGWGCCNVRVSPHTGTGRTQTDNRSSSTAQLFPCCRFSRAGTLQPEPAMQIQRDAQQVSLGTKALLVRALTPASPSSLLMLLAAERRSHRPPQQTTRIRTGQGCWVGSNPAPRTGQTNSSMGGRSPTTHLLLPEAQVVLQILIALIQALQMPSHRSDAQALTGHELRWSPPGPPPAARPALYPNPAP